MTNLPPKSEDGPTIEDDMSALRKHIEKYYDALRDEGVWIFLATLGYWSVNQKYLAFVAYVFIFSLFAMRFMRRVDTRKSFSKRLKDIKERIDKDSSLSKPDIVMYRQGLKALHKEEYAVPRAFTRSGQFMVSWAFFALSLFHLKKLFLG